MVKAGNMFERIVCNFEACIKTYNQTRILLEWIQLCMYLEPFYKSPHGVPVKIVAVKVHGVIVLKRLKYTSQKYHDCFELHSRVINVDNGRDTPSRGYVICFQSVQA